MPISVSPASAALTDAPSRIPPQQLLVAVDLATGAVQPYNLDTVGIHPKATPAAGR